MKAIEIESWALGVLEQLERRAPVEDATVELKAEWPEADKAARRIAGHANAARGGHILWLIGADEQRGAIGADYQELSNWWAQVQSAFDGVAPALQEVNVPYKGKSVVALCFDSSRAPFVVKNPAFGKAAGKSVSFEVPWREGTAVRTATRSDLILLLTPLSKMPKVEILGGEIRTDGTGQSLALKFRLRTYMTPLGSASVTFPFHKCAAVCTMLSSIESKIIADEFQVKMDSAWAKELRNREVNAWIHAGVFKQALTNVTVQSGSEPCAVTDDEIVIRGAGKIDIEGRCPITAAENWRELRLAVTLVEAVSESKVALEATFLKREGSALVWEFERKRVVDRVM